MPKTALCPKIARARDCIVPETALCSKNCMCQRLHYRMRPRLHSVRSLHVPELHYAKNCMCPRYIVLDNCMSPNISRQSLLLIQNYIKIDTLSLLITYITKTSSSKDTSFMGHGHHIKDLISVYHNPKVA